MNGYLAAVEKIDDLGAGLLDLSELHAFTLRVDPANFKVCYCYVVNYVLDALLTSVVF